MAFAAVELGSISGVDCCVTRPIGVCADHAGWREDCAVRAGVMV